MPSTDSSLRIFVNPFRSTNNNNTKLGLYSLFKNITGTNNTAIGTNTMLYNETGNHNSAFGSGSLLNNKTGHSNTAVGNNSLTNNVHGNNNTCVGVNSNVIMSNEPINNSTAIGQNAQITKSDQIVLGGMNQDGNYPTVEVKGDLNISGSLNASGFSGTYYKYVSLTSQSGNISNHIDITDLEKDSNSYIVIPSIYTSSSDTAIDISNNVENVVISNITSSGFTYNVKKNTGNSINILFTIFFTSDASYPKSY